MLQKRPNPASLLDGQAAVNTNVSEPGLFFKASDGSLFKVGPVAITSNGQAPNSAASGQIGNSTGEVWLDGRPSFSNAVAKVWNGTSWVTASGFNVDNSTGNFQLSKQLTVSTLIANGTGSSGYIKVPSLGSSESPESSVTSIGAIYFNTATNKFRGRNNTGWQDLGLGDIVNLTVTNDAQIGQDLTVTRNATLGTACSTSTVTVNGVTALNCNTTIGTSSSNTLTVQSLSDFQTNVRISSRADLRFHSGTVGASGYVGFEAPASLTGATIWTLPGSDGSNGQALITNGSGVLSWATVGGGGGGATVTIGDNPPTAPAPAVGNLWYNSASGRLQIYYTDGDSTSQWVDTSPDSSGAAAIRVLDNISSLFNGTRTSFPLTISSVAYSPVNAQQLIIHVNNVYQAPGTSYTISGTNIVFTVAPTTGQSFSGVSIGVAVTLNSVADNSIQTSSLQNSAVTVSKMQFNSSVIPTQDNTFDLGSPTFRFANVYTGDLHLKNDRGDWTMIEEEDFLTLRSNKTGKVYKLLMEEV